MEHCSWCDEEFDIDDWTDDGEVGCEECGHKFCSTHCQKEHNNDNHPHDCNSEMPVAGCPTCKSLGNVAGDLAAFFDSKS